ncbi:hypothetical protein DXG01_012040, partial [Tephrocybe rancida]
DFIPKLKKHLLPRIQALLVHEPQDGLPPPGDNLRADWQSVLLRQERIYKHNIMRVHFTSYDVRRGADVIHINTSHRNIMVFNPDFDGDSNTSHPYLYARVLGIYHANVIYIGHENADHHPRRLEFLWVRCFCDRDMLMRYHWGLGIGHAHADGAHLPPGTSTFDTATHNEPLEGERGELPVVTTSTEVPDINSEADTDDEPDLDEDDMVFNQPGSDEDAASSDSDSDSDSEVDE